MNTGGLVKFETLAGDVQNMLQLARDVRTKAYAPYSQFHVGACLLTTRGELHTGCNVENASFTVGTCAERCAIAKAVSLGGRAGAEITVVAVVADLELPQVVTPCGACRQMLVEFATSDAVPVYCSASELKEVLVTSIGALLPHSFKGF